MSRILTETTIIDSCSTCKMCYSGSAFPEGQCRHPDNIHCVGTLKFGKHIPEIVNSPPPEWCPLPKSDRTSRFLFQCKWCGSFNTSKRLINLIKLWTAKLFDKLFK